MKTQEDHEPDRFPTAVSASCSAHDHQYSKNTPFAEISVGVVIFSRRLTQGGSFLPPSLRYGAARATLGFEAESLWDSWTARLALQETEMRPWQHDCQTAKRD
jgi:hypothetical protein